MVRKVQFEGRNIIVPDDATDDEISQILGSNVPIAKKQGTKLSDVGRWIGEPYANIGRLTAEVPATLVTGMGSMLAGNVMGAASDIYSSVTGQPKVGEKVREEVMRDYTYQPRSAVAQEAFNLLGEGMKTNVGKLVQGLPVVGQELPILSSLASPATRTITGAIAEKAAAPSERIIKFAAQNQPKIDAAVQLRRFGMVADPAEVNPTLKNVVGAEFVRPQILDVKAAKINLPIVQNILRNEAGVEGNVLTRETLQAARDTLSKPYNEVRAIGALQANSDLASKLRASKPTAIVGLEKQVKEGSRVIDEVASAIEEGRLSASDAVDAIRGYRSQANNWYKVAEKGDAKRNPKEIAKAYQTVADTLEDLIESNIPQNSKLLTDFRKARQGLAKNYMVEALINKESGIPDLSKLSSVRFADSPLTGDLAALRQIQANFPEATAAINKYGALLPNTINRSSVGGTAGSAVAMAAGGAPVTGGVLGAVTSVLGGRFVGNRMLTPEYQAKNLFPNVQKVPTSIGLSLAPIGEPLIPSSGVSTVPQGRGMLSLADDVPSPRAELQMPSVEIPIEPRIRPLYQRGGIPKESGLSLVPKGETLKMPEVPYPGNLEGRGMLSLADDVPTLKRSAPSESINFMLRQEVLQQPEIVKATQAFISEAERLRTLIKDSSGFWKARYKDELTALENEFAAGMRQLGIDNPQEAIGLQKLYQGGQGTKLRIEKTERK